MPENELTPEEREALETGRIWAKLKKEWRVIGFAILLLGGQDMKKMALQSMGVQPETQPSIQAGPSQLERMATVEVQVKELVKKVDGMDGKLDRILMRPLYRTEDRTISGILEGNSKTALAQP